MSLTEEQKINAAETDLYDEFMACPGTISDAGSELLEDEDFCGEFSGLIMQIEKTAGEQPELEIKLAKLITGKVTDYLYKKAVDLIEEKGV